MPPVGYLLLVKMTRYHTSRLFLLPFSFLSFSSLPLSHTPLQPLSKFSARNVPACRLDSTLPGEDPKSFTSDSLSWAPSNSSKKRLNLAARIPFPQFRPSCPILKPRMISLSLNFSANHTTQALRISTCASPPLSKRSKSCNLLTSLEPEKRF